MAKWVEKWCESTDEPWNSDGFFQSLMIEKRTFNNFQESIIVPFGKVLSYHDLLRWPQRMTQSEARALLTWVSRMADRKVPSSICRLILSLACSTCLCPRRTASSTELALWKERQNRESIAQLYATLVEEIWKIRQAQVWSYYGSSYQWPTWQRILLSDVLHRCN